MRRKRSPGGFTLTELVVVMAIAAALVAITIPVARSLSTGNKAMGCTTKLQRLSQAIKMYALDEGSVPPFYPSPETFYSGDMLLPDEEDAGGWADEKLNRSGLLKLIDTGYLSSDDTLHCPADWQHKRDHVLYAYSYMTQDEEAVATSGPYGEYNRHKYLSSRGIARDAADADVRRQLTALPAGVADLVRPEISRAWRPDDSTVVMWCDHHYETIRRGGEGQYNVLFWDGSARRMDGALFRDPDRVDAWRTRPEDDPTP